LTKKAPSRKLVKQLKKQPFTSKELSMSDNLRRFYAIRQCLNQLYPTPPKGNFARHLTTLAALISGIVGSRSTNLPKIAESVVSDTKAESRIKKILPVY